MKFGQKLVYKLHKHVQKEAIENIASLPRKLILKFWSTGATMGVRGLNIKVHTNILLKDKKEYTRSVFQKRRVRYFFDSKRVHVLLKEYVW